MPKVNFVKSARKAKPEYDIKVGDSYYWWSMMHGSRGVKHYSKTAPKPAQLTNSDFLQQLYGIHDDIAAGSASNQEEFDSFKEDVLSAIETLKDETEDKLNNMPDGLQQGSTGELLQERIDALDSWYTELENVECDYDEDELRIEAIDELGLGADDGEEEEVVALLNEKIQEKVNEAMQAFRDCDCGL